MVSSPVRPRIGKGWVEGGVARKGMGVSKVRVEHHEEQSDQEAPNDRELAQTPKTLKVPRQPTQLEMDEHDAIHLP